MKEVWKDVKGFEGYYIVSNFGRVKTVERLDTNNHVVKERIKSTSLQGSDNTNSKLSKEEVEEIRHTFIKSDREFGASALGRKYGVTHRVILNIVNNLSYKH